MSVPPYGNNPPPYPSAPQPPWSPSTGGAGGYGVEPINDSGQKAGVPPQITAFKWHWGAFGVNWIWALNHGLIGLGLVLLLLGWFPFVGLIGSIYLGVKGHQLAWQNRRYDGGLAQYMQVESVWSTWGIVLFALSFLMVPIWAAILFPVFAKAREKAREENMERGAMLVIPRGDFSASCRGAVGKLASANENRAQIVLITTSYEWRQKTVS